MSAQKGYILPLVLFGSLILISGLGLAYYFYFIRPSQVVLTPLPTPNITPAQNEITDFESCVAAGNAVMESYPRQCNAKGRNFTETIESSPSASLLDTSGWSSYLNDKYRFSLHYPQMLKINQFSTDEGIFFSNDTPGELQRSEAYLSVHLNIESIASNKNFREWIVEESVGPMPDGTTRSQIRGQLEPYLNAVYTGYWYEGGAESLSKKVFIQQGNYVYIFSLFGYETGSSYKENPNGEKVLDKMIESLKFE